MRNIPRFVTGAITLAAVGFWLLAAARQTACGCPFCNAAMQTLSEDISSSDAALVAELAEKSPQATDLPPDGPAAANAGAAKFRVVTTLSGKSPPAVGSTIEVVYFGDDAPGKRFLVTAILVDGKPEWTTPIPLSERSEEYVRQLPKLPAKGIERIAFFQEYFEDSDPLCAQDAYDEFSRAPYADVAALGPRMHRDRLLKWIDDPAVGPSGRRLYLTMLGVCGRQEDLALLEEMINCDYQALKPCIAATLTTASISGWPVTLGVLDEILHADERRKKESLDALIACYLKLKGPAGLELVNQRFLANPTVEYKYLHAAIMALRFHGEQTEVLPREALLKSMRLALDHPDFADQVIPDLTRWDDWEVMPRLVKMFKEASSDSWIRQPVASYLLVAADQPGDVGVQARAALDELKTLDPETVERAKTLSAFSMLPRTTAGPPAKVEAPAAAGSSLPAASPTASDPPAGKQTAKAVDPSKSTVSLPPAVAPLTPPSRARLIGVPILAVVALVLIFAVLLRGSDPRSSGDEN
jgi:hypothetical protein